MSDARAKAEARRAKILAREKKTTISAVISTEEDDLYANLTEVKGKERPIAARKSLIESKATETPGKSDEPNAEQSEPSSPVPMSREDSILAEALAEVVEPTTPTNVNKEKKYKLPPKKSLEEIEREVAENTKKFDEKTLNIKPTDGDKDSTTINDKKDEVEKNDDDASTATTETKKETASSSSRKRAAGKAGSSSSSAETKEEKEANSKLEKIRLMKLKQANANQHTIEPTSIMRILRFLLIVSLATFTGYRIVDKNRKAALQMSDQLLTKPQRQLLELDEFNPSATSFTATATDESTETNTKERTWMQYFQYRLNNQLEASLSALMVVSWISRMFNPAINTMFKTKPKPKSSGIQMVMEFLSTGLSAWMESIYSVLGEVSVHFLVLILSVTLFTLYYSNNVNDTSANPLIAQQEL